MRYTATSYGDLKVWTEGFDLPEGGCFERCNPRYRSWWVDKNASPLEARFTIPVGCEAQFSSGYGTPNGDCQPVTVKATERPVDIVIMSVYKGCSPSVFSQMTILVDDNEDEDEPEGEYNPDYCFLNPKI